MGNFSNELRKLIDKADLERVLGRLKDLLPEDDTLRVLSSRFYRIKEDAIKGVIAREEFEVGFSRVSDSTLSFIGDREEEIEKKSHQAPDERGLREIVRDNLAELLANQYELIKQIGAGRTAVLFKAYDRALKRNVAIKAIKPDKWFWEHLPDKGEVLELEVTHAAAFKHRNLISLYAANFQAKFKYIIQEYIEGVSLKHLLGKIGAMSVFEAKETLYYLAEALYYGHQKGFIHESVRPQNILIDQDGMPILSPFRLYQAPYVKTDKTYVEDELYQSPEQFDDGYEHRALSEKTKSDQFSLGLVAYEMITGVPLFSGGRTEIHTNRQKVLAEPEAIYQQLLSMNCHEDLADIIVRMLDKDPDQRWDTLKVILLRLDVLEIKQAEHIKLVKASYNRCREHPKFFEKFYERFFENFSRKRQEKVRAMFTDLDLQYNIVNHAFYQIINADNSIDKILAFHGSHPKFQRNPVSEKQYEWFMNSLVATIREFDSRMERNAEIAAAWQELSDSFLAKIKEGLKN